MGAPTQYYVDPLIAGDSGTGTVGDPYGDLQYALNTVTRDATDGDKFNIKAGTDEILAAALDLTTYGTPTDDAPLIFRGYTSTADDGGIGGISGNGSYSLFANTGIDNIILADLHLHNAGSANIVQIDRENVIYNCEVNNTSGDGIRIGLASSVIFCHVHDCGGSGINLTTSDDMALMNFLENDGTHDFTQAITNVDGKALFNVIDIDGSSSGIIITNRGAIAMNNSIYASNGTGVGIQVGSVAEEAVILSNIVEGFSGVGGDGIELVAGSKAALYGYNAFYNNTTDETLSGDKIIDLGNNQSLGSSPFADAANDDFTVDTSVRALAFPTANYPNLSVRSYLDIGVLQRQEGLNWATLVRRIPI